MNPLSGPEHPMNGPFISSARAIEITQVRFALPGVLQY